MVTKGLRMCWTAASENKANFSWTKLTKTLQFFMQILCTKYFANAFHTYWVPLSSLKTLKIASLLTLLLIFLCTKFTETSVYKFAPKKRQPAVFRNCSFADASLTHHSPRKTTVWQKFCYDFLLTAQVGALTRGEGACFQKKILNEQISFFILLSII
jgi:hypothetical protein